MRHPRTLPFVIVLALFAPACAAEIGDGALDESEQEIRSASDCYPSGNRFNCRPPDGDPGYAPRVYNPHTRNEWWPIARGAHLRDGMGTVRGVIADRAVRVNLGMRKRMGETTYVYCWTVRLESGVVASGWVREGALQHVSTLRARMETLRLPDPGEGEYETDWVITGGDLARYRGLKVTRGFAGGGREATDYLTRQGNVVNLIYNTPGRELGGYSVDTFPLGAHFHRSRGVPQIEVPLYRPGTTRVVDRLHFVYGFVWDGHSRRYGWLAHEAITAARDVAGSTPGPSEPPPPAPPPADEPTPAPGLCYARCCDDALLGPIPSLDSASCATVSAGVCGEHDELLRARRGEEIVFERANGCWAKCRSRDAYHQVEGVTADCTEAATAYCAEGTRGGLEDAMWSQCRPI